MASDTLPEITSLAAPTEEDEAVLSGLTREEYAALLAVEIEKGRADIEAGRATLLRDEADIEALFDEVWPINGRSA